MVYGGIEHRMWATLFGRGTIDVERLADDYTGLLLNGLLRAAPPVTAAAPAAAPQAELERRLARLEQLLAPAAVAAVPSPKRAPRPRKRPA